ncbi:MAG: HEPN domain-containing protein [Gammaproteobacteria bacterium]|mgnify:CR=1|nr:MAG: HEPN domain-containing protein [Gammaproteobacteria bacterium]
MKNTVEHLPQPKQRDLNGIVDIITEGCSDVDMVILFGSYARGKWKEERDLKPDRLSGHASDYDIFVVTGEKKTARDAGLWQEIAEKCNASGISTHARIIAQDMEQLNIDLANGQYFYTEIKEQGCVLYGKEKYNLAEKRELTPKELQRIAQDYYDHWFERAKDFWVSYELTIERGMLNLSAFNLNQATESCYKTILLVFSGYCPHEHYLYLLESMASDYIENIKAIFPRETQKQRDLFNLLDYAYIGARYNPDYSISKEDLEYLSQRVEKLIKTTEKACLDKIQSFVKLL